MVPFSFPILISCSTGSPSSLEWNRHKRMTFSQLSDSPNWRRTLVRSSPLCINIINGYQWIPMNLVKKISTRCWLMRDAVWTVWSGHWECTEPWRQWHRMTKAAKVPIWIAFPLFALETHGLGQRNHADKFHMLWITWNNKVVVGKHELRDPQTGQSLLVCWHLISGYSMWWIHGTTIPRT